MLTVIEGGDEPLNLFKPELVKDDQGRVCMQVRLGDYTATLALPEHLASATKEELDAFFAKVVPTMTEHLRELANKERRKLRNKAKKVCSIGSMKSDHD